MLLEYIALIHTHVTLYGIRETPLEEKLVIASKCNTKVSVITDAGNKRIKRMLRKYRNSTDDIKFVSREEINQLGNLTKIGPEPKSASPKSPFKRPPSKTRPFDFNFSIKLYNITNSTLSFKISPKFDLVLNETAKQPQTTFNSVLVSAECTNNLFKLLLIQNSDDTIAACSNDTHSAFCSSLTQSELNSIALEMMANGEKSRSISHPNELFCDESLSDMDSDEKSDEIVAQEHIPNSCGPLSPVSFLLFFLF